MMTNNSHDDYVRQVRAIGESLIKNAESIVGSERYLSGLRVYATVDPDNGVPEISVSRDFYPEKIFEANDD